MSGIRTIIDDGYADLAEFVNSVPFSFHREGRLLFKARNEVRHVSCRGYELAVKRFASAGLLKKIVGLFRTGKACRSYRNACMLAARGIPTPAPVAYIEIRNGMGLLTDSYYICRYLDMPPIRDGLNEDGEFNREMTRSFARFAAMLHEKGVLHHDLNSTNVMFIRDNGGYRFTLIDINRMKIYAASDKIPLDKCLLNLTRFSCCSPMYGYFLKEYLSARNLPESICDRAIRIKRRHDASYARRKKITGVFKNIFPNKR